MADPKLSFVVALWRLPESDLQLFAERNTEAFAPHQPEIVAVCDRAVAVPQIRCLVYPLPQKVFSLAKTSNYGIRRAVGEIIVKTDPDIVFSPAVLAYILDIVRPKKSLVCYCALLRRAEWLKSAKWKAVKPSVYGYGACFAMHRDDWKRFCGYDERLDGWGAEDWEIAQRVDRAGQLARSAAHPLYHVGHAFRKGTPVFPNNAAANTAASKARGHDWAHEDWGLANQP